MSVNILLCEGAPKSPDVRVLTALLSGVCLVEPSGDKYGLPRWVRTNRGVRIASVIAALRDRDLEAEYSQPQDSPHPWRQNDERGHPFWLGWYWERVEIENYLVDPQVVQRSLGDRAPDQQSYQDGLRAAS